MLYPIHAPARKQGQQDPAFPNGFERFKSAKGTPRPPRVAPPAPEPPAPTAPPPAPTPPAPTPAAPPPVAAPAPVMSPARAVAHSPDFRSVCWRVGGESVVYSFSPGQAAVVRLLWEAWENGTPAVSQAYLLEAAGIDNNRISPTFTRHPSWGTLILGYKKHGGSPGTYRLAEPG